MGGTEMIFYEDCPICGEEFEVWFTDEGFIDETTTCSCPKCKTKFDVVLVQYIVLTKNAN